MVLEVLDTEVQEYIHTIENKNIEAQNVIKGLTEKQQARDKEYQRLELEFERVKEEYQLLLYKRFGRAAEQLLKDTRQQLLFVENEPDNSTCEAFKDDADSIQEIKRYTRKKAGRKPIAEHLHREQVIIDISDEEKKCACGATLVKIGEETAEKLHIEPPKIKVIQYIRYKYACRACEGTADEDTATVRIAPVPPSIIPRSIVTPGLLSTIMIQKYQDHLPFYRQELQFERIGVTISRQDMSNWQQQAYSKLRPLFSLLKQTVKAGLVMGMDETTVQVMGTEGKSDTSKSYMWLARGGPPGKPVIVYSYRESRAAKHLPEFLEGFTGYLQTDGYEGYDTALALYPGIRHIGCFSHARRYFFEAAKVGDKSILAKEAIGYIGKLYKIEKELRDKKMPDALFLSERGRKATEVLDRFKGWLDKRSPEVPPSLRLGKAIQYTLGQWDKLVAYLECAYLTPDNNACENAIRPFVLGRKNWLFNKSPAGAESSCGMYSLIETAKQNRLDPFRYLYALFLCVPLIADEKEWEDLLPWNIKNSAKFLKILQDEAKFTL
jgi:transposase